MLSIIAGSGAILSYCVGTYLQSHNLKGSHYHRGRVFLAGTIALLFHLVNVTDTIHSPAGFDLSFFKVATLFAWVTVTLVLISSLKKPLENLFLIIFPFAAISILLSMLTPTSESPVRLTGPGEAVHIILAILAMSTITIAAFQALFTAMVNYLLKHKQSFQLISHLPPLQTMEALLFEIVWAGLLLLTGVIITGALYMEDMFEQHLSHKSFFSIVSWCVFAILLLGRHYMGWRGNRAIKWTIAGFIFLVLAYFGSKFVLELVLIQG